MECCGGCRHLSGMKRLKTLLYSTSSSSSDVSLISDLSILSNEEYSRPIDYFGDDDKFDNTKDSPPKKFCENIHQTFDVKNISGSVNSSFGNVFKTTTVDNTKIHYFKMIITHFLQLLLIFTVLLGIDIFLRYCSNVDFNMDPNIMSTYCYRELEYKARNTEKFLLAAVDKTNFLNKVFYHFFGSMTEIDFQKKVMNEFKNYKVYRQRNINFETDYLEYFYQWISYMTAICAGQIPISRNMKSKQFSRLWILFCLGMISIIFRIHHSCHMQMIPMKRTDCPTYKLIGKNVVLSYD